MENSFNGNNPYYTPKECNLEVLGCIDKSDGCYRFDYFVVWRTADGRIFYDVDAGCSCPSPFENCTGLGDMIEVKSEQYLIATYSSWLRESDWRNEKHASLADLDSILKQAFPQ